MAGVHDKAAVITQPFAKIITALSIAAIIGGFGFAWDVKGETTNLKSQIDDIRQAALPSRMDKLEQKVDSGFKNQDKMLDSLDSKLDNIYYKLTNDDRRSVKTR